MGLLELSLMMRRRGKIPHRANGANEGVEICTCGWASGNPSQGEGRETTIVGLVEVSPGKRVR